MPHVETPASRCRLGIARCDITPPVGIYHRMWGAARHDRSTGVHRPLTATALVFQALDQLASPETEQAVLAVDHCLLGAYEMQALLGAVAGASGLAREQILVAFSHTHGAGLMGRDRVELPGGELIPPYLETLADRLGAITRQAREAAEPVVITYAAGRCGLAAHRDFWDEQSQQFVCGFNPDGPADDALLLARVNRDDGRLLATLVNYACHPTTLAWQNTLISPDYPGAMRELVEQATGAPCVFLQGASGDLGPRHGFVGDVAVAERNGRVLGHAVLSTWEGMPPPATRFAYRGPVVSGATIGTWEHVPLDEESLREQARWRLRRWTVDLSYRSDLPTLEQTRAELQRWQSEEEAARASGDQQKAGDCRALAERCRRRLARLAQLPGGAAFPMPVALWRIGGGFWLAVEGEMYQAFQRQLRERCAGVPLLVLTLANGSRPAYLPPAEAYGKGIYQESIAVLERGCLERLTEAVGEEMARWLRQEQ
jgi:hypothetical protein